MLDVKLLPLLRRPSLAHAASCQVPPQRPAAAALLEVSLLCHCFLLPLISNRKKQSSLPFHSYVYPLLDPIPMSKPAMPDPRRHPALCAASRAAELLPLLEPIAPLHLLHNQSASSSRSSRLMPWQNEIIRIEPLFRRLPSAAPPSPGSAALTAACATSLFFHPLSITQLLLQSPLNWISKLRVPLLSSSDLHPQTITDESALH